MKSLSDEELVSLYKSGNQDAFNEIYQRYKNLIKYLSRNLYLLGAEEGDLIQEGMLGLIKAVNSYKEGTASFKTFVITCIKSSLFSAVKKYAGNKNSPLNFSVKLESLDDLGVFFSPPEEYLMKRETSGETENAVYSLLSPFEIKVMKLYLDGYSYSEISEKLNKNLKSINNALTRARQKILKNLGKSI